MQQHPAQELCSDKPPEGGPQQLPDSVGNASRNQIARHSPNDKLTPPPARSEAIDSFPAEAKTRERERRKAQKAAGKAHVVKRRVKDVQEHDDACGEDLSSLIGKDQTR